MAVLLTLALLLLPLLATKQADMWAPLEVAKFESAICVFGKMFHLIQKVVSDLLPRGAALAVCCCLWLLVAHGA